jgi:competence protein ComGF
VVKSVINQIKTYVLKRNNDGFTYIEAIVSLAVMSLIVMMVPSIMSFFNGMTLPEDNFDGDFFIIDSAELNEKADKISISKDQKNIIFESDKEIIKYRKHNDRIIKTVNDEGFVTMMFNVTTFDIKEQHSSYQITIKNYGRLR